MPLFVSGVLVPVVKRGSRMQALYMIPFSSRVPKTIKTAMQRQVRSTRAAVTIDGQARGAAWFPWRPP